MGVANAGAAPSIDFFISLLFVEIFRFLTVLCRYCTTGDEVGSFINERWSSTYKERYHDIQMTSSIPQIS